jgi:hypothetical protein
LTTVNSAAARAGTPVTNSGKTPAEYLAEADFDIYPIHLTTVVFPDYNASAKG